MEALMKVEESKNKKISQFKNESEPQPIGPLSVLSLEWAPTPRTQL